MDVRQCEGGIISPIASDSSMLFRSHVCLTSSSVLFLLERHNASKSRYPPVIRLNTKIFTFTVLGPLGGAHRWVSYNRPTFGFIIPVFHLTREAEPPTKIMYFLQK